MRGKAEAQLREWKRKLVDLSKRNRWINFMPTRVSTIEIIRSFLPRFSKSSR